MSRTSIRWWHIAGGISAALIIFTFLFMIGFPSGSVVRRLLRQFSLAQEVNIAAWWSSVLLFWAAILSFELFAAQRGRSRLGGLIFAGIFTLLSWDELGSLHERLGDSGCGPLVPIGIVGAAILGVAFFLLVKSPATRPTVPFLLAGMLLMASIVLQEYLMQTLNAWPEHLRWLGYTLEESVELLGTLVCLAGLVQYRHSKRMAQVAPRPRPGPVTKHRVAIALVALIGLQVVATIASGQFTDIPMRGDPATWPPVAILIAMAVGLLRWQKLAAAAPRVQGLAVGGVLLLSLGTVYILGYRLYELVPILIAAALLGLVSITIAIGRRGQSPMRIVQASDIRTN